MMNSIIKLIVDGKEEHMSGTVDISLRIYLLHLQRKDFKESIQLVEDGIVIREDFSEAYKKFKKLSGLYA